MNKSLRSLVRRRASGRRAPEVAKLPAVGRRCSDRQRAFRQPPGLVADGRDMGTVVFPDAVLKVFLTASVEVRAQRRYKQLIDKGNHANLAALSRDLEERDKRDAARAVAPLKPAVDAVSLDSSGMTVGEVVDQVLKQYEENLNTREGLAVALATFPFCNPTRDADRKPAEMKVFSTHSMASVSPAVSQAVSKSSAAPESFAALFEESLTRKEMRIGEVITAEVIAAST